MSGLSEFSGKSGGAPIGRSLSATVLAALALVGVCGLPASADEIYFRNGYSVTAVVIRDTEKSLRFKTEMGLSTISKEKIDFVDQAASEENRALLKKWREKELRLEEQLEARREAQKKFGEEQRSKGLVKFEDEWMTPERQQEIVNLKRRADEHQMQFEDEQRARGLVKFEHIWVTPKIGDELLEMSTAIDRLNEDLKGQAVQVDSLRAAMLVGTLEDADDYSKRIDKVSESIAENNKKLSKLYDRADDIEAISVKYEVPEEFIRVLPPEGEFE